MLPSIIEDGLNLYVFPLAILKEKEVQFVLASQYVGPLYMCVNDVIQSIGRYDVVTHVESCFFQISLSKRLFLIASKLMEFLAMDGKGFVP